MRRSFSSAPWSRGAISTAHLIPLQLERPMIHHASPVSGDQTSPWALPPEYSVAISCCDVQLWDSGTLIYGPHGSDVRVGAPPSRFRVIARINLYKHTQLILGLHDNGSRSHTASVEAQ